jgi:hypothetical protein
MTTLRNRLALAAVLFVLWFLIAATLYVTFVSKTDHTDFFPLWAGARLALFEAQDPYARETTTQIQQTVYGHARQPTEDQQGFTYPAHLIPLLLPFWLLPMRIASALWSSLSVLMVLGLVCFLAQVSEKQWWIPALIGISAHVLLVVFQGQLTIFVAACLGLAYWTYTHGRTTLAGLFLVATTIKPELVLLPAAALLVIAVSERRSGFLLGLSVGGALLVGMSVVIAGFWVPRWLNQLGAYRTYAQSVWPVEVLYRNWPICALVGGILLALAATVERWDHEIIFATVCAINIILLPQTLPYSLTILLVPVTLTVLARHPSWTLAVPVASWGAIFLPYQTQMVAVPVAVLGGVLFARHRIFTERTRYD